MKNLHAYLRNVIFNDLMNSAIINRNNEVITKILKKNDKLNPNEPERTFRVMMEDLHNKTQLITKITTQCTPLQIACCHGNYGAVRILLRDERIDPNYYKKNVS